MKANTTSFAPLILISNDDGVEAAGLIALVDAVQDLGEVIVVAPDSERSGSSHAITFHTHLRAVAVREGWWKVSGTPVDCVYLAMHHLCARRPSIVLAGVNAGYNLGSDVFYSGTLGAAAEGALRGVPAIAFSVDRGGNPHLAGAIARRLTQKVLADPSPRLLNVNVPVLTEHQGLDDASAQGVGARLDVDVTRLGARKYKDDVLARKDPHGRPYFWIGGPPTRGDDRDGDDTWSVAHGRISVTPLEMDITAASLEPTRKLLGGPSGALTPATGG